MASIFVNPTQFAPNEDFGRYPRASSAMQMMKDVPVDRCLRGARRDVSGGRTDLGQATGDHRACAERIDGALPRSHHGGRQLFIVKPHYAMFGEKDFQQLRAIQQMVRDQFDLEIIAHADRARV